MKVCKTCGLKKEFSEYTKHHTNLDGLGGSCSLCMRAKKRAYYYENKPAVLAKLKQWRRKNKGVIKAHNAKNSVNHRANQYWYNIQRRYGLTKAQYLQMHVDQNQACAICLKPNDLSKKMHVDHDHATGLVRGLLCSHCNHLLGYAKDEPAILSNAIAYLERSKK